MLSESIISNCGFKNGGRYDVVVVGGGSAGFGAAIAAARRGLKTLIIDNGGFAGGTGTKSCVPVFTGIDAQGVQIISNLCEEYVRRMDEVGAASLTVNNGFCTPIRKPLNGAPMNGKVIFKLEYMKLMYRRMLDEAGVKCLFYTHFVDAVAKDGRVSAILVSCIEGATLIEADTFIDCTGDALLCHAADPNSVVKYGEEHNKHKSMFFLVGGVTLFDAGVVNKTYAELYQEGRIPGNVWAHFGYAQQLDPGVVKIAVCYASGDAVDSAEMTRMDGELRENVFALLEFLRKELPGFENCYIIETPSKIGVRAGQAIIGKESVNEQTLHGECDTTIVLTERSYGFHSNNKQGLKNSIRESWATVEQGVGRVPMGAMVPVSLKNVLAAGRCISTDPRLIDTFRYMSTCMTMGEAAGLMSFVAKNKGIDVCNVEYADLLPLLKENSFILDVEMPAKEQN